MSGLNGDAPAVLLVDDRTENLLALEAVLAPLPCRTVTATSGEKALRALLQEDFATILLDVQMPGLDGFETAEYVRGRERTRDVPIIFVTAAGKERRHVFQGYAVGAVDYVFKPYDPEVLRAKVAVFLRLHAATRALAQSEAVLRAAFDWAPIGMARLDAGDRVLQANRALGALLGRDPRALAGRTLGSLAEPEDAGARAADRAALLAGRRGPYDQELRLVSAGGEAIPCLASFSLAQAPGQADAVIAQVQDLRERRRAEAEREALVREQTAREEAERAAGRLRAVQRLSDAALAARTVDAVARELLLRVGEVVAADAAAVVLPRDDDAATVHRIDGSVRASLRTTTEPPPSCGPGRAALADGAAAAVDDVTGEAPGAHPLSEAVRALLVVPLRADGEVVGVLFAGSLSPGAFGPEDAAVLALAADRTGPAVERLRRFEEEHAIATRLQRSMSPAELPRLPGLFTAARYRPGGPSATEVGGDWYDAVPVADGGLLLVMGDVAGRGVGAAAMMGQLRSAIRAYALLDPSPAAVLTRVNAFHVGIARDTMATVLLARLDAGGGALTTASAGHPPALVTSPGGGARWVTGGRGVPLGALDDPGYEEVTEPLEPGSTVVLYSDGLVEQRGEDLSSGLARLEASVLDGPAALEALADHVLERAGGTPGSDDVSLLVVRTVSAADDHVVLATRGDAAALTAVRGTLRRWLEASGADPEEVAEVTMAANEAVQNAIEHAHGLAPRPLDVELVREAGTVTIVVRDQGAWRRPGTEDRGRGIPLMRALMGDVRIDRRPEGTEVTLRRRLRVAASASSAASA